MGQERGGGPSASSVAVHQGVAEYVLLAHAVVGDFNRSVALLFGFRFLVVIDLFRSRNFPVVFAIRRSNLLVHSHDLIRMFSGCRWARS
jgi:hypothetical protein